MSNIHDKIKAILPEVTIEENGLSMVVVPFEKMPMVANYLSEKESFDSLVALIGNDWGDSLGVVYIIDSTKTNERVVLKTSTTDKENPMLYSVVDVWPSADLNEREVYDFFGIRFIGDRKSVV